MLGWILSLKIRLKLLLAFGSILFLSVILIGMGIYSTRVVIAYNVIDDDLSRMNINALQMNRYMHELATTGFKEEGFLESGQSELITRFVKLADDQRSLLSDLMNVEFFADPIRKKDLVEILESFSLYEEQFKNLVDLYHERGFKDHGIEGRLRHAIHAVEDMKVEFDRETMLTLRRHEKDFFLRKDLKYLEKFNNTIEIFMSQIESREYDPFIESNIRSSVGAYKGLFNHIVALEEKIGFNPSSGKQGELNTSYRRIETLLKHVSGMVRKRKSQVVNQSEIFAIVLLGLQIAVGLLLALLYSNLLTKAIKEIRNSIVQLLNGTFPEMLKIRTKDEVGVAKNALNQLVERMKVAIDFANGLGEGKLTAEYDSRFKEDVLATSILSMQTKLLEADKKQAETNWINKGFAEFSILFMNDENTLKELSDAILKKFMKYLNLYQGAVYLVEGELIKSISLYAYEQNESIEQVIRPGQGMLGQCILDGETIYSEKVPNGYTKIMSGLGDTHPRSLLIVPLKIKKEVLGAIELASLKSFDKLTIEFVEKISERIASVLSTRLNTEKTEHILNEFQIKTNELANVESELRLTKELLQAEIESKKRNTEYYSIEIKTLKKELAQERVK